MYNNLKAQIIDSKIKDDIKIFFEEAIRNAILTSNKICQKWMDCSCKICYNLAYLLGGKSHGK